MNPLMSLVSRTHGLLDLVDSKFYAMPDPLRVVLAKFAEMRRKAGPLQFKRCKHLLRVLGKLELRSILELGSGFSTAVFNYYGERHDVPVVSFEDNPNWIAATRAALEAAGLGSDVRQVEKIAIGGEGVRFDGALPDVELIYVDGPSPRFDGALLPDVPRVCLDVPILLESGKRPRFIVVDGRFKTLRRIAHPEYRLQYEYMYGLETHRLGLVFNRRAHSVLTYDGLASLGGR